MFPAARAETVGRVEIRIVLDRTEPPAGRLRVVDPEQAHEPHTGQEVGFYGWLAGWGCCGRCMR
jgi:hypothetical protein